MLFTDRRGSGIWVGPALAMVASVAILVGVAAIMAVVVAAACGAALLRAIGAIRPATPSVTLTRRTLFFRQRSAVVSPSVAVPFPEDRTIEGVVVHSTDHGVAR